MNCADNTGAKNLYVIAVYGIRGRLNRLPAGCSRAEKESDASSDYPAEENLQEEGRAVHLLRGQRGVIVNNKGEMKGSAITGPVAKECADLGPGSLRTRAPFAESCNNRAVFFDLVSRSYDPLTSSFKFNLTKNHKIKDNKVGLSQHNREKKS